MPLTIVFLFRRDRLSELVLDNLYRFYCYFSVTVEMIFIVVILVSLQ